MERMFILFLLLIVVLLNPFQLIIMLMGFLVGSYIRNNYSRLKMLRWSGKKKEEEDKEDEGDSITQVKNPFDVVDEDVVSYLNKLGLNMKIEDDDLEYLQGIWDSIRCKK
ncbi:U4 protein [Black medic leaf roll virus]|uniref:U4 protein n=1 Tax=Black medic leaf roll virus TaxID=2038729 RepID=V9TSN2_9VIRU|nr:U4 protein [Black medic leaf roll virus]AHC72193.1 U4 protein [Black medic leaf roll virus]